MVVGLLLVFFLVRNQIETRERVGGNLRYGYKRNLPSVQLPFPVPRIMSCKALGSARAPALEQRDPPAAGGNRAGAEGTGCTRKQENSTQTNPYLWAAMCKMMGTFNTLPAPAAVVSGFSAGFKTGSQRWEIC